MAELAWAPIYSIPQQPQRQDALEDQLRDIALAAARLGCYDAADWILRRVENDEAPDGAGASQRT